VPAPQSAFRPVDREQLADQVIKQLRAYLVSGDLQLGQKLPSVPELMAQFSVGRTTIREAVRALVYAGFLQARQGDVTYVRSLSPGNEPLGLRLAGAKVQEVFELRRVLELDMVRLAAQRRSDADLHRMADAVENMARHADPGFEADFLAADIDFHIAVAIATRNSVLEELYKDFAPGLRLALSHVITLPKVVDECLASKTLVYEAIKNRNAELARRVTERHLDNASARIERLIAADLKDATYKSGSKGANTLIPTAS
jgi:DNA-binding FadR family transcriptional regulator